MADIPDVYVKFEDSESEDPESKDLDGECLDVNHSKWIGISRFSFGFDATSDRPPPVSLTKRPDLTSTRLLERCHSGQNIAKVKLEACRYGGEGREEKIPFVRLTFEEVHLTKCDVSFSDDARLEETVEFEYKTVIAEYIWTANDTGTRVRGASSPRASWTLPENVEPPPSSSSSGP